jgi:hypothetical protein
MYKCLKCELIFNNPGSCIRHQNSCNLVYSIIIDYNSGISISSLIIKYKSSYSIIKRFLIYNDVHIRSKKEIIKKPHSIEVREKISQKRKEFLKENPDKHPWKNKNKFKSKPCENFKSVLDELGIEYISEHTISDERLFSIDISLPQYRIGIEINGNQHYDSNGLLLRYYQDRHDFLENLGYKIYELHYSLFFDRNNMIELINSIITGKELFEFDYDEYLRNKLVKKKYYCSCSNQVHKKGNICKQCCDIKRRKVERPDLDVLLKDIEELGYSGTGRKYGVSDNAIRKWIKK